MELHIGTGEVEPHRPAERLQGGDRTPATLGHRLHAIGEGAALGTTAWAKVRELTPEEIQAMTAGEVEKAQAATTERMQALEKQLAQADPDTATFKVLFTSWQETYGKMMEALERIKAADSDKADKLQGAIRAVVEGMA